MTARERVLMALNHEEADRVPIHDGPWVSAIERWHDEGLPREVNPAEYFDFELVGFGADFFILSVLYYGALAVLYVN